MTTLTTTESIPIITTDFPNWQPAAWEDYLSDRNNSNPERVRAIALSSRLKNQTQSTTIIIKTPLPRAANLNNYRTLPRMPTALTFPNFYHNILGIL